jgi:hypothetical protein
VQDFHAVGYITSPEEIWWLREESNLQLFVDETNALPFGPHSHRKPAEESNLVPFRPTLGGAV